VNPQKILIVRFSSIGDIVLTLPVIDALREHFPQAALFYLTKTPFIELIANYPGLEQVIQFEGLRHTRKQLRKLQPDLIIDLHANLRSHLISLFHSMPVRRYQKQRWQRQQYVWFKKQPAQPFHTVDNYLNVLRPLGVTASRTRPTLPVTDEAIAFIDQRYASQWKGKPVVGLVPGALHSTKQWLPERYRAVAHQLTTEGIKVIVIGSYADTPVARQIQGGQPDIIDTTGQVPLRYLPALLAQCQVVVCNDTGPMHIAVAVGTPVIAIFGSTTPALGFSPLGEHDIIIETSLACRPCHLHGRSHCPKAHFNCMKLITSEEVIDHIHKKLYLKES